MIKIIHRKLVSNRQKIHLWLNERNFVSRARTHQSHSWTANKCWKHVVCSWHIVNTDSRKKVVAHGALYEGEQSRTVIKCSWYFACCVIAVRLTEPIVFDEFEWLQKCKCDREILRMSNKTENGINIVCASTDCVAWYSLTLPIALSNTKCFVFFHSQCKCNSDQRQPLDFITPQNVIRCSAPNWIWLWVKDEQYTIAHRPKRKSFVCTVNCFYEWK